MSRADRDRSMTPFRAPFLTRPSAERRVVGLLALVAVLQFLVNALALYLPRWASGLAWATAAMVAGAAVIWTEGYKFRRGRMGGP